MINLKIKNIKRRKLITKYENSKYILNLIYSNKNFNNSIQSNLVQFKNKNIPINSCSIKLTKRCILTNNNKILNSHFSISRSVFLKFARLNLIFGVKKNYG
nr:ribosomal protein S14 [Actinocyclus sp. mgcode 4]